MGELMNMLSGWTGIDTGALSILLVFALVVVVIVVAFVAVAIFLTFRPTRDNGAKNLRRPGRRTG